MAKQVRLTDVAAAAGVSTATASMSLNDSGGSRISGDTRQKVRDAAAALGYTPNTVARGLRTNRSHMLGFVSDDVATTPYAGQMIRGAHDAAKAQGYLLLMVDTMGDEEETNDSIEALRQRQIDGIIMATMYHQILEAPPSLSEIPHVFLDARAASGDVTSVVPDEIGGTRNVLQELGQAGHRRIGHITTAENVPAKFMRRQAWQDHLEFNAIDPAGLLLECTEATAHYGYEAALEMLQRPDRPTAIFCFNDRLAMGVYRAAAELKLIIPSDVSIASYDNQELISAALHPGLTSAALPHYEMGHWAAEQLLRRLDNPQAPIIEHQMPCPVVQRDSIGPVPLPLTFGL